MLVPGNDPRQRRARLATALLLAALALAGIGSAAYVYLQVDRAGRQHILERAATVAVAIEPADLASLSGTPADVGLPAYDHLKSFLWKMRSANADARFLYVIGKRETGELFFYADSESSESPDYSPPGQVYYEATPAMRALFEDGVRVTEGPDRDRWGLWISGYAPVLDADGDVIAIFGMDLPAARYLADAAAYALLPLFLTALLGILMLAVDRTRRQQLRYVEQRAEFLSIASHEIRTPLTGIRWAVEGLLTRQNPPLDPKTRTVLALVHESCLALIGRVNNLLDLSKLEDAGSARLRPEEIGIPAFLEDIADSLALSAAQREVAIVLDDSVARAGTLVADRQMMHHAFFNLLTNAVKYTRAGTPVRVSYEHEGGMHRFRVSDQGDGIPRAEQERIFSGYYRTKDAVKSGQFGTGLGLYLAKKAAELHGGSVTVASEEGQGATFIVTVPETVTPAA